MAKKLESIGDRNKKGGNPVGTNSVLKPGASTPPAHPLWNPNLFGGQTVVTGPSGNRTVTSSTPAPGGGGKPGGGGGGGGSQFSAARSASHQQNDQTRSLVDAQSKLLGGFASQRDTKLSNISRALEAAQAMLLDNYGKTLTSLDGNRKDNEAAEADSSFRNVANAVRERGDILGEAAMQGAGETDLLRSQLNALRNYSANQSESNRSFFDTLRSINNSVTSLNNDTATSRTNLFNQAESDRESTWSNYYNQVADTWTQIGNIENAGNVESASTEGYRKQFGSAPDEAAKATGSSYSRQAATGLSDWEGKGKAEDREVTSSNRAASVNLGGPVKRAEGATLRKWK